MGIVYEPNIVDSQGDIASEGEIRKAAFKFMENVQKFKLMHKGDFKNIKVLESYIAPIDFEIGDDKVKKGSWILTCRILDDEIWKKIKVGEIEGFSMAGRSSSK